MLLCKHEGAVEKSKQFRMQSNKAISYTHRGGVVGGGGKMEPPVSKINIHCLDSPWLALQDDFCW